MKITKRQLKRIIAEEKARLQEQATLSFSVTRNIDDAFYDLGRNLQSILGAVADLDADDPAAREYIKRKIDEMIRDYGF